MYEKSWRQRIQIRMCQPHSLKTGSYHLTFPCVDVFICTPNVFCSILVDVLRILFRLLIWVPLLPCYCSVVAPQMWFEVLITYLSRWSVYFRMFVKVPWLSTVRSDDETMTDGWVVLRWIVIGSVVCTSEGIKQLTISLLWLLFIFKSYLRLIHRRLSSLGFRCLCSNFN